VAKISVLSCRESNPGRPAIILVTTDSYAGSRLLFVRHHKRCLYGLCFHYIKTCELLHLNSSRVKRIALFNTVPKTLSFIVHVDGVRLRLWTAATNVPFLDDIGMNRWYLNMESHSGMILTGEKPKNWDKNLSPVPFCPTQIPHGLTRERTRASAVKGRRVTAWTSFHFLILILFGPLFFITDLFPPYNCTPPPPTH
jgi:hypothetical protein